MSAIDFAARGLSRKLESELASTEEGSGAALVRTSSGASVQQRLSGFATRAQIAALDPSQTDSAYLNEPGREGMFVWRSGDHIDGVTRDWQQGIHIAREGDEIGQFGAWVRAFDGPIQLKWFGAACDGEADDTIALQAAFDVADVYFASPNAPRGTQYPVIEAEGLIRLTQTVVPCRFGPTGFCGLEGRASYTFGIVWDYRETGTHIPVFDNGSSGDNFRLKNCVMTVADGATLPSTWIKTTGVLDWGFAIDGSAFGPASECCIECAGFANLFLRHFRFRETGRSFLLCRSTGAASYNRLLTMRDWTMHPSGTSTMTSIVDFELAGSDQYMVRFEGQRIEMNADSVDPSQFDLVRISGETTQAPAVTLEIDGGGWQINSGTYPGTIGFVRSATATNKHVSLRLRNFKAQKLDHFVAGNVANIETWPAAAAFERQIADFEFATSGVETLRSGLYSQALRANPLKIATTPIAVVSGTADLTGLKGNQLAVTSTAPSTLTTLSNRGERDLLMIRSAGANKVTINNGGNFSVVAPVVLSNYSFTQFVWDQNSSRWRLLEPGVRGTTSTVASPSADVASLKTAVDAIRAVLTASGVTP